MVGPLPFDTTSNSPMAEGCGCRVCSFATGYGYQTTFMDRTTQDWEKRGGRKMGDMKCLKWPRQYKLGENVRIIIHCKLASPPRKNTWHQLIFNNPTDHTPKSYQKWIKMAKPVTLCLRRGIYFLNWTISHGHVDQGSVMGIIGSRCYSRIFVDVGIFSDWFWAHFFLLVLAGVSRSCGLF